MFGCPKRLFLDRLRWKRMTWSTGVEEEVRAGEQLCAACKWRHFTAAAVGHVCKYYVHSDTKPATHFSLLRLAKTLLYVKRVGFIRFMHFPWWYSKGENTGA